MAVRIELTQGQEQIDPTQENWKLVNRFANHFTYPLNDNTFSGACDQAFEAALEACNQKKWKILSQDEVQDDLARLAVYIRGSLVHYAITEHKSWAAELIEQRIDIHSLDFQGNTALHTAAREGTVHLIPLLSTHNDLHKENYHKQTPLETAIQFGKDQVVLELIKRGVNIRRPIFIGEDRSISLTGIGFAVVRGEIQCIEKLILDKNCSLQDQYGSIGNILHVAIHFHQFKALGYMLEAHRDMVNHLIEQKSPSGLTPLILAASIGELEPIHLLRKAGGCLESEDHQKQRPIHYAAKGLFYDTIQLLAALGCKIDPVNEEHQRPIDLISRESGRHAISCQVLLKELKANKALATRFPAPHFEPPKNLVFRGGGPKGIAYLGALNCLHEQGHLDSVKRVAGTSAGAITACLLAVGSPVNELQKLLKTNMMTFLDHPFSPNKLIKKFKDKSPGLKVIHTLNQVMRTCYKPCNNPLGSITNLLKKLYQCTGLCEGEVFRVWIEDLIEHATGEKYFTFGELATRVEQDPKFKHLHVYGTKIGNDPQIVAFSSQDPDCKDMIISDAIRISMSIPGIFKPHIMHILQKNEGKRHRLPHPSIGSFLDGGMLYNFPVETFDQKQYLTHENLGPEGKCPKYNKETLGFSLFSSLSPPPTQSNVENIGDLLTGIAQVYLGAEVAIRALNPYNQSRVIEIDVKDVRTLSFNMSDQKKYELMESGYQAVNTFIDNQTQPLSIPHIPQGANDIKSRQANLMKKRMKHPDLYPPYLDHLLEKGYFHLFDHLLTMAGLPTRNDREKKIEDLPFSEISHIVLETQKCVIDQVTAKVPVNIQNILFLLGQTGAGKSTTFCFLRGDKMQLDRNGNYSSINDQELIGHDAKSCTFLPTVEIVDDLVLVDFPGFSDTNGSLIALGMECGLKNLIKQYHPKILVIESITNTEGRYVAVAQLGTSLKRLLGSLDGCILGITKYTKDMNFIKLQSIEADQKRQQSQPSHQRIGLEASIQTLANLVHSMPNLKPELEKLRCDLDELKEKEDKQLLNGLPVSVEKNNESQEINRKEQTLKNQIGISHHVSFFDLEDHQQHELCLDTVSLMGKEIQGTADNTLDEKHECLLIKRFEDDLKPTIARQSFDIDVDEDFERKVLDTSLIKVLLSSSHPEVGDFLHLSEMDPKLATNFSKNIVEGCISKLIHSMIKTINVTLIKNVLENFGEKASSGKKETLQTKQALVQKYIFGLIGKKEEEQTDKEWEILREEAQNRIHKAEDDIEQIQLTLFWKIAYAIPLGIPLWLYNSQKQARKERAVTETVDGMFDEYCASLDAVYSALTNLKKIETIILKQEDINKSYKSTNLSFVSLNDLKISIEKRTNTIRNIYGNELWDERVNKILQNSNFKFFGKLIKDFFTKDFGVNKYLPLYFLWLEQNREFFIIIIDIPNKIASLFFKQYGIEPASDCLFFEENNKTMIVNFSSAGYTLAQFETAIEGMNKSPDLLNHIKTATDTATVLGRLAANFYRKKSLLEIRIINMKNVDVLNIANSTDYALKKIPRVDYYSFFIHVIKYLGMYIELPLDRTLLIAAVTSSDKQKWL